MNCLLQLHQTIIRKASLNPQLRGKCFLPTLMLLWVSSKNTHIERLTAHSRNVDWLISPFLKPAVMSGAVITLFSEVKSLDMSIYLQDPVHAHIEPLKMRCKICSLVCLRRSDTHTHVCIHTCMHKRVHVCTYINMYMSMMNIYICTNT